jgi:HEAT repeat protein
MADILIADRKITWASAEDVAVERLIKQLADSNGEVRCAAAKEINSSDLKFKLFDPLIKGSKDPNACVRLNSVRALGKFIRTRIDPRRMDLLLAALIVRTLDPDPNVKLSVFIALDDIAQLRIPFKAKALMVNPLIAALHQEDKEIKVVAVRALGEFTADDVPKAKKGDIINALLGVLKEKKVGAVIRNAAAESLVSFLRSNISAELKAGIRNAVRSF